MVVSIGKCANAGYYTDSVGAGRESYYLDAVTAGEPPGLWSGRLAEQVGLVGEVAAEDMKGLFSTFTAPDGTQLGRMPPQYRSVEDRLAEALADEPGALPERVAELRARIEATHRQACLGWDVTASVPKSVTVAHTAVHRAELQAYRESDPERAAYFARVRSGIEDAIRSANQTALEYTAGLTTARAGWHGARGELARWEAAPDLAVASFFQHTSRSIQPQLHVHNVILNRAGCTDGQIRALDGQDLLAQRAAIGAVFDLDLAVRLADLGLDVRTRPDGMARELVEVDTDACDLFSERRRTISAALAPKVAESEEVLGRPLTDLEVNQLAREVTLRTRRGKTHDGESVTERLDRWQAEFRAEFGKSLDPIARKVATAVHRQPTDRGTKAAAATAVEHVAEGAAQAWSKTAVVEEAVAALAEQRPTWRRSDLLGEIARRIPTLDGVTPGKGTGELLNLLTDHALAGDLVVQVTELDGRPAPDGITGHRRRTGDVRYAAAGTLAAEDALRRAAVVRGRHHVDAAAVHAWLDGAYPTIGADQRAAVAGLAASDAAVAVFVGPAGTGKSFTAGALAGAWADLSGGGRVIGLAASQNAADVLAADGLPVTANLAAFGLAQARLEEGRTRPGDEALRVGPRDLILVDEASMISTADLARVQGVVEQTGARLILAGDPRQLGSVGAGGVMGLLTAPPDPTHVAGRWAGAETYTLSDVRRFTEDWEAAASLQLRQGDPAGLAEYDRHGRIIDCPDLDAAVTSAARSVVADRLAGHDVLAVADTNDLAARVSVRVRDQLLALGLVDQDPTGQVIELGRDQATAGIGDLVELRRNDRALGVVNRGRGQITAIGDDGSLTITLTRYDTSGSSESAGGARVVRLPAGYVAEHVSLGYCTTGHGAEGLTVDTCHVVTAGVGDAASVYVPATRGRIRNTLHVALSAERGQGQPQADAANAVPAPTGAAVLADALARNGKDDAAIVTAEADHVRRGSAATLLAVYEDVVRQVCRNRLETQLDTLTAQGLLSEDDRARLCADQGTEHLSRLLRAVEQSGHDPATLLRAAIEGRKGFGDAVSIAQVLSARISGPAAIDTPTADHAAAIPAGIPAEHADHLTALRGDLDDRRHTLGAHLADLAQHASVNQVASHDAVAAEVDAGAATAPRWLTELGPAPTEPIARREWEDRAGRVAFHREATGWTDPDRALPAPAGLSATERRASWWDAARALGGDQTLRDEVAMTDGQLRIRITAWAREQAWAPPHADTALRAAHVDRFHADRDQRLAAATAHAGQEALTDAQTSAADGAARGYGDSVTRALDRTAEERAAWAASTAATRAAAERAGAEAARRGLVIGAEPDRLTTEELLAADRHARVEDDAHRVITETDIHDHERAHAADLFDADDRSPHLDHPSPSDVRTAAEDAAHEAAQQASHAAADSDTADEAAADRGGGAVPVGAHAVLDQRPTTAELAAAESAAHAAAAVIADRRSQEAAAQQHTQAPAADWEPAAANHDTAAPDLTTAGRDRRRAATTAPTAARAADAAITLDAGAGDAAGL